MQARPLILALAIAPLAACSSDSPPDDVTLPGDAYFPENVHAAPDGTLYVPSLGTGQVVKLAPGASTPTTFIAAGDPKGVSGLYATSKAVWLCAVDLTVQPPATEVRKYSLAGSLVASYPFSQPAFCNDLVEAKDGTLYVSDSFGAIWKLPAGGDGLAVWASDALLQPPSASGFGADGIALDDSSHLYVTNFSKASLLRIAIASDGSTGSIVPISIEPAPMAPDGLRWAGANTLIWADGAGTLTSATLDGERARATTLATDLAGPTSVVRVDDTYWVSEGQLAHLLGGTTPDVPFTVRAIPAN